MARATTPIGILHDELLAFAQQADQKLLVIETEDSLRKDVLEQVECLDVLIPTPAVVSIFESPWMDGDGCWDARHEEFEEEWVALGEAFRREKRGPLARLPAVSRSDAAAFASCLQAALSALEPHFESYVVALAPLAIEDVATLSQELAALVRQQALNAVRWVVVSVGPSGLQPLIDARPKEMALVRIEANPAAETASLKAAVGAMALAPVGAHPAQLAGGVGPSIAPPARKSAIAGQSAGAQNAPAAPPIDLPAGVGDAAAMQSLRVAVMGAALAAGDGDFQQAIEKQRQARATSARLGMAPETAALDLILGAYGLMAKQPKAAIEVFADVETRAHAAGWGTVAVQSAMARAGALTMLDRRMDAAAAYVEGGRAGTKFGAPALAIESFGLGGQVLVDLADPRRAIAVWNEALLTAESAKPEDVAGSSVLEIAQKGIELLRRLVAPGEAASWAERRQALQKKFEAAEEDQPPQEAQA